MTKMEPSPGQFADWLADAMRLYVVTAPQPSPTMGLVAGEVARLAYAAGADAELEACCEWVQKAALGAPHWASDLLHARRPEPPSLKQQAFKVLSVLSHQMDSKDLDVLTKALAALPDD